jgi:hypothetical protein
VVSVVTDGGILRRHEGTLRVAAVPAGEGSVADRVRALVAACGYVPELARTVEELGPVHAGEVGALRQFDRQRLFLN